MTKYKTAMTTLYGHHHPHPHHHPRLNSCELDMSFTMLPPSPFVDDLVSDVCFMSAADVLQPQQLSTFQTCASSSADTLQSLEHAMLDDQHIRWSVDDSSMTHSTGQTSASDETSWSKTGLMSSDELDECLSHLLMTSSQPDCHGNHSNAAADWLSELKAVRLLADELQPSQGDVDRLHLTTSQLFGEDEHCLNMSPATDVRSPKPQFTWHATESDKGAFNFLSRFFYWFNDRLQGTKANSILQQA